MPESIGDKINNKCKAPQGALHYLKMMRLIHIALVLTCVVFADNLKAQCTFERFLKYYPANPGQEAVIILKDKSYITLTSATLDSSTRLEPVYISLFKADSCGRTVWEKHYGESFGSYAFDLAETDSGNILVIGHYGGLDRMRMFKHDRNGNLLWNKVFPTGKEFSLSRIEKRNGKSTFLVNGYTANGPQNPYIVEIDEGGAVIRQKEFPVVTSSGSGSAERVLQIGFNYYIIASYYGPNFDSPQGFELIKTDTSLNIIWRKSLVQGDITRFDGAMAAAVSSDAASIVLGGNIETTTISVKRNRVVKYDLEGQLLKIVKLPDSLPEVSSIAPTKDNGYILGPWFFKLDSSLAGKWAVKTRSNFSEVCQLGDGGFVAVGSGIRDSADGRQLCLVKADSNGVFLPYDSLRYIGAAEVNSLSFGVYPNPAHSQVTIEVSKIQDVIITLTDAQGKNFGQKVVRDFKTVLDIRDVPQGLYFIAISDTKSGRSSRKRVVVLR